MSERVPDWMKEVEKAGGFEAHGKVLSDKAAKEFATATKSIEKTSKGGGLMKLSAFFKLMEVAADNPVLKVLSTWFDMISKMFNAEFADVAQVIADVLFSESMIDIIKELASIAGECADELKELVKALKELLPYIKMFVHLLKSMEGPLTKMGQFFGIPGASGDSWDEEKTGEEAWEDLSSNITLLGREVGTTNTSLGTFIGLLGQVSTLIGNIRLPGGGNNDGGGGGGGFNVLDPSTWF